MVKYSIAMGIRVVCIALCLVVQGWWLIVFAAGAIVLPYFAVVVANAQRSQGTTVLRPGNVQPSTDGIPGDRSEDSDDRA